jgi:hypothetical protein
VIAGNDQQAVAWKILREHGPEPVEPVLRELVLRLLPRVGKITG